jgi:hypothetical protein
MKIWLNILCLEIVILSKNTIIFLSLPLLHKKIVPITVHSKVGESKFRILLTRYIKCIWERAGYIAFR